MQHNNSNGVHLEEEMILQMQRLVTGRTDEALNARFGISYNTWRKLLAGQPIRPSLADRLKGRIATLDASNPR
ncbi:MAG: hypothetical protein A2095_07255 [Sphingomonadales bacterium GWF1_63_6]|nr:MAG: hypothetical protein A2095_07255 [Sphingomonadales bacterium GWF1_63_6]